MDYERRLILNGPRCQKVMICGSGGGSGCEGDPTVLFDETASEPASERARLLASQRPKTPNRKNDWSRNNGPSVPLVIAIIWPRPIDKIALLASPSFLSYRRKRRCKVKYLFDYANERWKEADRPAWGQSGFPPFRNHLRRPRSLRYDNHQPRGGITGVLPLSLLLSAE